MDSHVRALVLSDVDLKSVVLLSHSHLPESSAKFDVCLLLGPLPSEQETASAIIQELLKLVNHVIYSVSANEDGEIGSVWSSSTLLSDFSQELAPNIRIGGFVETTNDIKETSLPMSVDRSADSDEELEDVRVIHAGGVLKIQNALARCSFIPQIFMLTYANSITLNQFLFFMPELIGGIKLCLLASHSSSEELSNNPIVPPQNLGGMRIIAVRSLSMTGSFTLLGIHCGDSGAYVGAPSPRIIAVVNEEERNIYKRKGSM